MRVKDLFVEEVDAELRQWLEKFESPIDVINSLKELFTTTVDKEEILGKREENVTIKGPVYVGKGSVLHPGVFIQGPVYIGQDSVLHPGVVIQGPVIIKNNVSVKPHAYLRKMAYIASNCVVGKGAHIKHSLCLNGSKIQHGTFVGDSVLGAGARIASGVILANRRFDQKQIKVKQNGKTHITNREFLGAILGDYVRIGANAVLSPGTIVGPYTWVGSGVVLYGTHESDLIIGLKQDMDIRKKDRFRLRSGEGEYEER